MNSAEKIYSYNYLSHSIKYIICIVDITHRVKKKKKTLKLIIISSER